MQKTNEDDLSCSNDTIIGGINCNDSVASGFFNMDDDLDLPGGFAITSTQRNHISLNDGEGNKVLSKNPFTPVSKLASNLALLKSTDSPLTSRENRMRDKNSEVSNSNNANNFKYVNISATNNQLSPVKKMLQNEKKTNPNNTKEDEPTPNKTNLEVKNGDTSSVSPDMFGSDEEDLFQTRSINSTYRKDQSISFKSLNNDRTKDKKPTPVSNKLKLKSKGKIIEIFIIIYLLFYFN